MNPKTSVKDMKLLQMYTDKHFSLPERLPISYTYAGIKYNGLPSDSGVTKRFADANMIKISMTGVIAGTLNIKADCIIYRDYPVIEWTAYFTCGNCTRTDILENVSAIDTVIDEPDPILVHNNGDFYSPDSYTVSDTVISDGVIFEQAPEGGRACDKAYPYQRLLFKDYGMNISIGWPGQWKCKYTGTKDGVIFTAGQEITRTYIKPGETLRTPKMSVMVFDGDEARGINVWRRWFNAHVTPRHRGDILQPRAAVSENGGGIEFTKADENNQLEGIKYVSEKYTGLNLWWIDAGWYPCINNEGNPDWPFLGTWSPDPERFPNGFKPVGDACKAAGLDLLVWFEPERFRDKNAMLYKEHRDWLLQRKDGGGDFMLNLADPDCHKWLCETISALIKESGIVCYRQDCNFWLVNIWRDNEEPDRLGMLENMYIQGYLAYWDYLLMENPDLFIDSCASGGRRNDLETMRRSVPLHPTDYGYGYHHVNQAFRHTLHSWIPYTRGWAQSWDQNNDYYNHDDYYMNDDPTIDNFLLTNGFGSLMSFGSASSLKFNEEKSEYIQKMIDIWHEFSQIQLHGDFYALTENHRDFTRWTVFQFDRPEYGDGVFQVLRNNQAAEDSCTVTPYGFCDCESYKFTNKETGESFIKTGKEITFEQELRSGSIWFYNKIL